MRRAATSRAGWTAVAFGDVVRLSAERSSNPEADGFERFVGLEHIEPGDLRVRRWGDIADGTTFTSVFRPGQVLFGKRRAYQRKVAVADFSGVCSGDIYVLEPRGKELLPELLPFICQSDAFFEHAVGTSAGSLSPRTNWTSLSEFQFALPPIKEQLRIVEACTAVDGSVATLHQLVDVARITWLATIQYFEDQYAEHMRSLGDLLEGIEPGRSVVGSDRPPVDGEYGVLRVSAVDPLGFQPNESKMLLDATDFVPKHSVRAGDILVTRANTAALVGESCIVDRDFPNLMLCDKTLRLVPKAEVSKNALWHMLQSSRVRQQILAAATGTGAAMKNVSQPKFRALSVCLPPSREASAGVETRLDECIRALRECRSRLAACRAVHRTLLNQVLVERGR